VTDPEPPEAGSGAEPMPFAIDLLAGIEILLALGATAVVLLSYLAPVGGTGSAAPIEPIYERAFREPGPTVAALLAGPPILIAIGLFLRKPWGRHGAILLHAALGACAVWQIVLRFGPTPSAAVRSADTTIVMLFLLAQAVGVPLFLRRKHLRAAFARGTR
jgi:hypothetical protein